MSDLFRPFQECRVVWPCGQFIGASTTNKYVCRRCWDRLTARGEAIREMQANYARGVAETYGPRGPA